MVALWPKIIYAEWCDSALNAPVLALQRFADAARPSTGAPNPEIRPERMSAERLQDDDARLDLLTLEIITLLRSYGLGRTACQQYMAFHIHEMWPESVPPPHPTLQ